jgi:TRAP-type C4-dicarboxylate transport system permease small subunit
MRTVLRHLDRAEEYAACALFFVLYVILTLTIVLRFGFSIGYSWMEEISRVTFVWVVMLGAVAAMRRHVHIRLSFGLDFLPMRAKMVFEYFGEFLLLVFCLTTAWYGLLLILSIMQVAYVLPSSGLSMFWAYLCVPVSFFLQGLRVIMRNLGWTTD